MITHVLTSLETGGAQKIVYDLIQYSTADTHSCTVVALSGGPYESKFKALGVPVTVLGDNPRSLRSILKLRAYLRLIHPDVVHAHLFPASLWVSLVIGSTPAVYTEHSLTTRRRGNPLWRVIDSYQYSKFSKVSAVSRAAADSLEEWVPGLRDKVSVVYNGVPYPDELHSEQREIDVLFVGRLVSQKGCDIFLRALAVLRDRGVTLTARIVGDGPEMRALQDLATSLQIGIDIFIGQHMNPGEFMRQSKVVAVPSRNEAFGLVAAEAMAYGAVPVGSAVGGLTEVIEDGRTGFTVPADEPQALAGAIERLLDSPAQWSDMSQAARRSCKTRFSVAQMCQNYSALYHSCLQQNAK